MNNKVGICDNKLGICDESFHVLNYQQLNSNKYKRQAHVSFGYAKTGLVPSGRGAATPHLVCRGGGDVIELRNCMTKP